MASSSWEDNKKFGFPVLRCLKACFGGFQERFRLILEGVLRPSFKVSGSYLAIFRLDFFCFFFVSLSDSLLVTVSVCRLFQPHF